MQQLVHPYVVTLHYAFQDSLHIYFCLEFVSRGDLYEQVRRFGIRHLGVSRKPYPSPSHPNTPSPRRSLSANFRKTGVRYTSLKSHSLSSTVTTTNSSIVT